MGIWWRRNEPYLVNYLVEEYLADRGQACAHGVRVETPKGLIGRGVTKVVLSFLRNIKVGNIARTAPRRRRVRRKERMAGVSAPSGGRDGWRNGGGRGVRLRVG